MAVARLIWESSGIARCENVASYGYDRLDKELSALVEVVPPPSSTISVVIPSYGGAPTIITAVDSALDQNNGDVSLIVVIDDACPRTRMLLEERNDDRITLIVNSSSLGAAAARNRGLGVVNTRYVLFLDADDRLLGNLLSPLIAKMEMDEAQIGFAPSINWSPRRGYYNYRLPNFRDHQNLFCEWFGKSNNVNTCSVAWDTSYLRSIGGWDEKIRRNQDGELAMRAILMSAQFATSTEGAGVWANNLGIRRITTRIDNLGSMLDVAAKLLPIRSNVISEDVRREAFGRHYFLIAHVAFSAGQDAVGKEALARRRALGFSIYHGSWKYIVSTSLRVFPVALRLRFWAVARYIRDMTQMLLSVILGNDNFPLPNVTTHATTRLLKKFKV